MILGEMTLASIQEEGMNKNQIFHIRRRRGLEIAPQIEVLFNMSLIHHTFILQETSMNLGEMMTGMINWRKILQT